MVTKPKPTLIRLRRQLKARGITQLRIAAAAGVKPPHVCNVLAGRDTSRKIIALARSFVEEASHV